MKYNYWVIYILPKYIDDITAFSPGENDFIYAYTDSQEILENFVSFHDTNKFKIKKYKITRDECRTLNIEFQNRYLQMVDIVTNNNGKPKTINISMTIDEKNLLDSTKYNIIWKITGLWHNMTFELKDQTLNIFNKKYKKILKKSKIHNFISYVVSPNLDNSMDEFAIYYFLFSKLLKRG